MENTMTEVTENAVSTDTAPGAALRKRTAIRKTRVETIAEATPAATRRRARLAASSSKEGRVTGKSPATSAEPTPPQTVEKGPTKTPKQSTVLTLLKRQEGATIDELMEATAWQAHSVRGFLSAVVRKKLALTLVSDVVGNGIRRYRITDADPEPEAAAAGGGDDTAPPLEEASPVPVTEAPIGTAA
jgi:hypothetical protein